MFIERTSKINAEIDMTPLIDVVFQLLIFLMVSSQFTQPEQKVNLPTGAAQAEKILSSDENNVLVILADNSLLLNDDVITKEELESSLAAISSQSTISQLEIRGDQTAHLGIFIEVIETAKSLGIQNLSYHKEATPQ